MPLNSYPSMMQEHLVARVRRLAEDRRQRLAGLTDSAAVQAYQAEVRAAIGRIFAPLPERTPLETQVVGEVAGAGCRIEKLVFASRPGCLVTANLYLPERLSGKAPGVLVPCGHSHNGKANAGYQQVCLRLARAGFVALIYDPINQGERDQYHGLADREAVAGCCAAHNMMGKQLELLGDWFGTWRTWDGIRALDVLAARPEVDTACLGLTGNSGGGTLTSWLWAVDERFTMAAPGCFVTTTLANLENELPADNEQYPPGMLAADYDVADFFIARAPKPVLFLGQRYDFFDPRGLAQVVDEVRAISRVLGHEEQVAASSDECAHGYSAGNQVAMVRFFARHAGLPAPVDESAPEPLPDEALLCTPAGNTVAAGAMPVFVSIARRAAELRANRPALAGAALRERLAALLRLPAAASVPHYRALRAYRLAERVVGRYAVESEPGIVAILKHPVDDPNHSFVLEPPSAVTLYLPHLGSEADIVEQEWTQGLFAAADFYALDVRGLGESMPALLPDDDFLAPYGKDYMFHGFHLMLDDSYLGRRVHDVLATVRLLRARGAADIHLAGRGQGALLALLAGTLDEAIASVTLREAPESWEAWASTPIVDWPAANFLRGALHEFDLPDLRAALGQRLR